jgi:hypothetical protein
MPAFRAMIWNVQNFGSTSPAYVAAKGQNSAVLARFIAEVVRHYTIDLLVIQEVQQTAGPALVNVRNALNAGLATPAWCFDWIKGAFAHLNAVNGPNDLAWNSGRSAGTRRAEGYAVFWKNDTGRFRMVRAEVPMSEGVSRDPNYNPIPAPPANCLELTRYGRELDPAYKFPAALKGFRPNAWQGKDFDDAYYPDVNQLDKNSLFWEKVRRPAYCVVRLGPGGGTDAARLCPIVAYHAPSNRSISAEATYLSGLAEQLYVTRSLDANGDPTGNYIFHDLVIAGGDFNLSVNTANSNNWSYSYSSYWKGFSANWKAGMNGTPMSTDTASVSTTVQVNSPQNGIPIGPPIVGNNFGDFLFSPIDNVFVRGGTAEFAFLYRDVMFGNLPAAAVQLYYDRLYWMQRNHRRLDRTRGPLDAQRKPVLAFVQDWRRLLQAMRRGTFIDFRQAAEFVHGLVSDHQPVIGEVQW